MLSTWKATEPGIRDFVIECLRLARRSCRRPAVLVAATLLLGGLVWGGRLRRAKLYPARVVVTIVEGTLNVRQRELTRQQLRNQVLSVVFSQPHLLDMMKRFNLFPGQRDRNFALALETMRDRLGLEVFSDYALAERRPGTRRFARMAITYEDESPATALAVARQLGQLVFDAEDSRQDELFKGALLAADAAVKTVRSDMERLRRELALREWERAQGGPVSVSNELALTDLRGRLVASRGRAEAAEHRRGDLTVRLAAQKAKAASQYVTTDPGFVRTPESRLALLTRTGVLAFGGALVLSLLLVGTFDGRLYDGDDVRRFGLEFLGHIPASARQRAT